MSVEIHALVDVRGIMEANTIYLLDLLSKKDVTFFIPPYQRNYEWTKEQCQIFLDDMQKTCTRNVTGGSKVSSEHFFGTVTYFQTKTTFGEPDKLILVDGQQRITTTMLFLAALRDVIVEEGPKAYIDSHFLKNATGRDESRFTVKLKQVETDWAPYRKIILGEMLSSEDMQTAIYKNYSYFRRELINAYGKGEENVESLDWVQFGLNLFRVVTIALDPERNSWENPQEIFESMNSLGKPLSLADLVRNYLLMGLDAEEQTDYYDRYWLRIEQYLPGEVSNFIRDYMQLKKGRAFHKATDTNTKSLYRAFKDDIVEEFYGERETFFVELLDYAKDYAVLLPGGKTHNAKLDAILEDLRFFKATTAYVILLALLHARSHGSFTDEGLIEILGAFRIYLIRRRLCGLNAAENREFPRLAVKLSALQNAPNKKAATFEILANQDFNLRVPNDIEFASVLREMNFYNFQYGKFCFALMEEGLSGSRPDLTDPNLRLEHIMPQTLTEAWRTMLGPKGVVRHQQEVHLLGNLTLIRGSQELGQKPFPEKKLIYEGEGGLEISKIGILNQVVWTSECIQKRTEQLIDCLTLHALPLPEPMRTTLNAAQKGRGRVSLELLIGEEISFCLDPSIKVRVLDARQVDFEGRALKLSPLTQELMRRRGQMNDSGDYRGAWYWMYDGKRLVDIEELKV